jgi:hypothetical protein
VCGPDGEHPTVSIDVYNFAAGAVDDARATVVGPCDHAVADGTRPLLGHELVVAEPAVALHPRVRQGVELGDMAASVSGHHRVLLAGSRSPTRPRRTLKECNCRGLVVERLGGAFDALRPARGRCPKVRAVVSGGVVVSTPKRAQWLLVVSC